jgi:hypothetical protein
METQENGPDDSSIRPVSSLLSKFENLKKDPDAPKTPVAGQRQASVGNRVVSEGRPQSAGRLSASPTVPRPSEAPTLSVPRARRMTPPRQRPVSMMAAGTPPQPFPPLVTVDSPKSSPMDYSVESRLARTTRNASPSTQAHSRNLSRAATPALEQRMSAFLVDAEPAKSTPTGNSEVPFGLNPRTKSQRGNGPPPVNRAGKPKIPVKPAALSQPTQGLTAPEPNPIELTDHSASPFSTPPSSAASSPAKTPMGHARARSDASFVERLRGDSDASSLAERARSGSTNSNIEPLSLPESRFETPPLRQAAAPPRDNRFGLSRAPTMPARTRHSRSERRLQPGISNQIGPDFRPGQSYRPVPAESVLTGFDQAEIAHLKRVQDGLARASSLSPSLQDALWICSTGRPAFVKNRSRAFPLSNLRSVTTSLKASSGQCQSHSQSRKH